MAQRITIDPITRIEGHLRVDVDVEDGKVVNSWSSGQMWRGIEVILQGKDPRDAWAITQRICGVCTTVHAITSVRAVENALQMEVPLNAQYIRSLIMAAHGIHDHVVHFYHLSALDWVDIVSALEADPAEAAKLGASLSDWHRNSEQEMKAVQDKLKSFVASGQLGIFAGGYWGHPAMKLPPHVNLMAAAHYLQALEYQRKINEIVTILGSKTPHIQNVAVGGVANPINLDSQSALNMERLYHIRTIMTEVDKFVKQVYLPDVAAVGALYADWTGYGAGVTNYLAVPDMPLDTKGTKFGMFGGYIEGGDLSTFKPIENYDDKYFEDGVKEAVKHAWYSYEGGDDKALHPYEGETTPNYTDWDENGKYSWIKSPTFYDKRCQVGPLSQVLCMVAGGHEPTIKYATGALDLVSSIAGTKVGLDALHSTIGRHAARAVRAAIMSDEMVNQWNLLMENIGKGDMVAFNEPTFPSGVVKGFGYHEAPRGVLSHWVVIDNGKIANYQCVVPTTWNAGPRDDKGQLAPYEASLMDNPVADPEHPLEVLRTVHSFDPCLACSIHLTDTRNKTAVQVKAL